MFTLLKKGKSSCDDWWRWSTDEDEKMSLPARTETRMFGPRIFGGRGRRKKSQPKKNDERESIARECESDQDGRNRSKKSKQKSYNISVFV
jgi:hypothetical protein